jgi:hypothetical protein
LPRSQLIIAGRNPFLASTMKRQSRFAFAVVALALPLIGQAGAKAAEKLIQELKTKEAAAKKDPDAMADVAKWAAEKALAADATRIYQAVLKLKPDHARANEALGNVLVDGKWLTKADAEALRKKAIAAENTAKGLFEVAGIWVEKAQVDDANNGVFHHDGERVTREEKLALLEGKVRHPETGELIDASFLEKAKSKYFPVGSEGRWVDEKEADTYHSDTKRPWVVRTNHGTLISTLPLAAIQDLKVHFDQGYERILPVLGGKVPTPARRPAVLIAATESEFRDYGRQMGDGTDVAGSFLMREDGKFKLSMQGELRPGICYNEKNWGVRYLRHAAALAYANAIAEDIGADFPLWFLHGLGSYTSRLENDSDAGHFAKLHLQKGGVRGLKSFFSSFAINGDMESKDIDFNLFQAGLLIRYAANAGDKTVTAALEAVTAAVSGKAKASADKAVLKLQSLLVEAEPKIAALCKELAAKAP